MNPFLKRGRKLTSFRTKWTNQWKMLFNSGSSKQAQEIIISRKNRATNHGSISLNNMIQNRKDVLKHLGLLHHVRLSFVEQINAQIKKANKVIGLIRKLHLCSWGVSVLTIYKSLVWPYFEYGNTIYNQPNNFTLSDKIEIMFNIMQR